MTQAMPTQERNDAKRLRHGASSAYDGLEAAIRSLGLALPVVDTDVDQDEEWALVQAGSSDRWERIDLHDYERVFDVQGLYEKWVCRALRCDSPRVVVSLLARAMQEAGQDPKGLTALDLGAGNGCVAEVLARVGVQRIIGVDICPRAASAAQRDRPGLYAHYVVGDLADPSPQARRLLDHESIDALVCVAALGYGHIPPETFRAALDRVGSAGWVAFNIKADFLDHHQAGGKGHGFAAWIRAMLDDGTVELVARERYVHRLAPDGSAIHYEALVARKR